MITRRDLLKRYGTNRNIAALTKKISESAVRQWPIDGPVPDEWQLVFACFIDPDHFKETIAQFGGVYPRFRGNGDARINPRILLTSQSAA